ncbi:hypothetical protein HMPREF9554_00066 [Treponema phagedenis F0421]|nr:hypothetical protein HMPREF9554_00066 [Treponema phagedenis F0421]
MAYSFKHPYGKFTHRCQNQNGHGRQNQTVVSISFYKIILIHIE